MDINKILPIILVPIIGAFIGYFTNYLAIKMIFRPRSPIKIGPIKIQGLVPKRKEDLAYEISNTIETKLLSSADIIEVLKGIDTQYDFNVIVEQKIDEFLNRKLMSLNPMLASLLPEDIKTKIKDILMDELKDVLPNVFEVASYKIENYLNIRDIIYDKIKGFSDEKLEEIILAIASKELKYIEILGGILGFIIGIIQVLIFYII